MIASVMGANVMEGGSTRSGCNRAQCDGATKWGRAKPMVGDAVMGELFVEDEVEVGANDWGTQSWGDSCR